MFVYFAEYLKIVVESKMARSDGYFTHFCILFTLVLTVQGRAYSETCAGLWTKGCKYIKYRCVLIIN